MQIASRELLVLRHNEVYFPEDGGETPPLPRCEGYFWSVRYCWRIRFGQVLVQHAASLSNIGSVLTPPSQAGSMLYLIRQQYRVSPENDDVLVGEVEI